MISGQTKEYFELGKRNDVRERAKRLRRQFLRYKDAEIVYSIHHRVAKIQIIQPNEVEQILIKPGQELVTLLTCHPYASGGRQRYLVICERVNENN